MDAKPKFVQLQITFPNEEEARAIAETLVERRLVACAQILGPIESRYVWRGVVNVDSERLMLAKTRESLFQRVADVVENAHSYECPQIVAIAIDCVSPKYESWLEEQIVEP